MKRQLMNSVSLLALRWSLALQGREREAVETIQFPPSGRLPTRIAGPVFADV